MDVCNRRQGVYSVLEALQQGVVVRLVHAVDIKAICLEATGNTLRLRKKGVDLTADQPENIIPEVSAVERIDGVELLDIQGNGVKVKLGMILVEAVCVFKEEMAEMR